MVLYKILNLPPLAILSSFFLLAPLSQATLFPEQQIGR